MSDASIDASLGELTTELGANKGATRHITVGRDAIAALGPWLDACDASQHQWVICDPHTRDAAAAAVCASLEAAGLTPQQHIIDPDPGHADVVCSDATIDALTDLLRAAPDVDAIAVGAGTINDIVKMATFRLDRPYRCVPTAASMNGYTSAIAAVLSKGVKRTLPAQQAEAIFADIGVLCAAPARLNRAGFGDLLSKPYSHADWLLSHLVRDLPYLERPARLLDTAYEALLACADSVGAAEPDGIGTLTRTILLSGFTMAIAGTSSPASGGEHLVSHYWDMEQHCRHEALRGLHGTQVGIATRISALLFERLMQLTPTDIDPEAAVARRGDAGWLDALAQRHPRLTAEVVAEVREQIAAKQRHGSELRDEITGVRDRWPDIQARLGQALIPAARMTEALAAAGAPDRPSAIGVDREHAVHTVRVCREIRSRYVGLDLMADLGMLDAWAADVVEAVEA